MGTVTIGGGAPVSLQSMLDTDTLDVPASLDRIDRLKGLGCDIVRVAIPSHAHLDAFATICAASPLPVVADVHFDHRLAVAAAGMGAAKLRINPGNIGTLDNVDAVIDAAQAVNIPIRIGVNAGSLAERYHQDQRLTLSEKMVASAVEFVEYFQRRGFTQLVVSAKAADVAATVATYELLSAQLPELPLHLGITEAGTTQAGTVRSAVGIGALLLTGIGDTIRVSLTASPTEEVRVGRDILAAVGLDRSRPQLISCPTCGRCQVDLIPLANRIGERLEQISKPLVVAVMGCVVNGPGEAAAADVGVACGRGTGAIFRNGAVLYTVAEDQILDALFKEINNALD